MSMAASYGMRRRYRGRCFERLAINVATSDHQVTRKSLVEPDGIEPSTSCMPCKFP